MISTLEGRALSRPKNKTRLGRELARIYRFNFSALFALVFRIGERMISFDE